MIFPFNATIALSIISEFLSSLSLYPVFLGNIWSREAVLTSIYMFSYQDILDVNKINENQFPDYFFLGAGSSAYQIEGAYNIEGKGLSIWDIYTHLLHNNIADRSNGDKATESYHLYETDVSLAKELYGNAYRFSISWTRILPTGTINKVNLDGIKYYNNLINEIVTSNMTPVVTMHQYDYPYELFLLGGWTNPESIIWFTEYANILFQLFGDRVKYWITFNKPEEMCAQGYGGIEGTIKTDAEDYLCGHNILLSHANVYQMYKEKYQNQQRGYIGISLNMDWYEPLNISSVEDNESAINAFVFKNERFFHPLVKGDYSELMKEKINGIGLLKGYEQASLPSLNKYGSFIKGKVDFIGIDYFTTIKTTSSRNSQQYSNQKLYEVINCKPNIGVVFVRNKTDPLIKDTPKGLAKLLIYLNSNYVLPPIYITGNGYADDGDLNDINRVKYLYHHLSQILELMKEGIDIRGYFVWSLLDSFEWLNGYTIKYGLYSVDFSNDSRVRKPKLSRNIIRQIFATRKLPPLKNLLKK